jgi:polyisoprenyl-phosphate glycosyltransferase
MIVLSVVVPCYNEQEVLPDTGDQLLGLLRTLTDAGKISPHSRIYFVDDGSRDKTWSLIEALSRKTPSVCGIKLSRNRGHQSALLAGLFTAAGDAIVTIDADLQDDIGAIGRMVDEHLAGSDIVYGVRDDRTADSFLKRFTAETFYKVLRTLGVEVIYNHADYRLMSRRAIEALKEYREVNLYVRGMIPLIGFRSSIVSYKRGIRAAGESKYPLSKMISLAWEGVTSMSVVPLRFVTSAGIIVFVLSIFLSLAVLAVRLYTDRAIPGWASTVLPIYLLGGVQLLCIGILGEYLGKVYKEVKSRPRYTIEADTDAPTSTANIAIPPSSVARQSSIPAAGSGFKGSVDK